MSDRPIGDVTTPARFAQETVLVDPVTGLPATPLAGGLGPDAPQIQGAQSDGGPASGINPILGGGFDGTNIQSVSVDTDGRQRVVDEAPTPTTASATIANGGSLSDAVTIAAGKVVRGFVTPAAWTAAALSFDVSIDGATFKTLRYPDGTELSLAALTLDAYVPFPTLIGAAKIRFRSGLSGSTTNQGAERTFTVVMG